MIGKGSTTRSRSAALLLSMLAIAVAATTAFFSWRGRVPFPEPEFLTILDDLQRFGLAHVLWKPIEGHRMAVPRAIQVMDYGAFGGTNRFTLVVVWAMNALGFLWVLAATTGELGRDRLLRAAVLCLGAILVFGPYYAVYAHGQHANYVVTWFLSVASLCSFAAACRRSSSFNAWLGAAIVLGWSAGLSLLPGLFVWPAMAYLALAERQKRLLLVVAAGSLPVFAVQAAGSQAGGLVLTLSADPLGSVAWISRYLGSIFGQALFFAPLSHASDTVATTCGALGLAAAAILSLWWLWRPRALPPGTPLAGGILLLALTWIVSAAVKHPESEGLLERYFFVVGWFWFAMVAAVITVLKDRRAVRLLVPAAAFAAILALGPNHALTSLRVDARGSSFDAAQIALLAGIDDPQLHASFPLTPPHDPLWDELRRMRNPPFDTTPSAERIDVARLSVCGGHAVARMALTGGGWRLGGDLPTGARWILVLDDKGEIAGVGRRWRAPLVPRFFPIGGIEISDRERWWGYARLDPASPNTAVIALDHGGAPLCRLG